MTTVIIELRNAILAFAEVDSGRRDFERHVKKKT
jgi:hypothetical protein